MFRDDVALAYARISRAVRLTLAMQTRVLRGLEPGRREAPPPHGARSQAVATADGDAEARERMVDRDDLEGLLDLPFAEAVALICHDLGLAPEPAVAPAAAAAAARSNPIPSDRPAAVSRAIASGRPSPQPKRPRRNRSP